MLIPERLTPEFVWDDRILRYRLAASGRFVSQRAVTGALENVIKASETNIEALAQSMLDGNISVNDWRVAMRREVKRIHVAAGSASKGGTAQMTQGDWGRVGQLVRKQYQYLDNFAQQIESGKQPLNGTIKVRSKLYAGASHGTYEEMNRRTHTARGYNEERRTLGAAEHCAGCLEEAAKGWQPIGSLAPIGSKECRTNCRCTFEYRQTGE